MESRTGRTKLAYGRSGRPRPRPIPPLRSLGPKGDAGDVSMEKVTVDVLGVQPSIFSCARLKSRKKRDMAAVEQARDQSKSERVAGTRGLARASTRAKKSLSAGAPGGGWVAGED